MKGWAKIDKGLKGTLLYASERRENGEIVTYDVLFKYATLRTPSERFDAALAFAEENCVANKTVHAEWTDEEEGFQLA